MLEGKGDICGPPAPPPWLMACWPQAFPPPPWGSAGATHILPGQAQPEAARQLTRLCFVSPLGCQVGQINWLKRGLTQPCLAMDGCHHEGMPGHRTTQPSPTRGTTNAKAGPESACAFFTLNNLVLCSPQIWSLYCSHPGLGNILAKYCPSVSSKLCPLNSNPFHRKFDNCCLCCIQSHFDQAVSQISCTLINGSIFKQANKQGTS